MEISKKVGIWVRVSSQDSVQKDNHINHKFRAEEFAKNRGWKVVKIYSLEALSGSSVMGYSETKQMLHDVQHGVINTLVFNKIARLARNTKELIEIAEFFSEYDANLVAMDMSIDTSTAIGRHFYRTMSSMAEWELEMISDRVKAGALSRAKRGVHVGGQAPFGFTYENKKLVPHTEEAPVLRLMFELFLEHKRKKTVARILNERGYRTKKGNKFTDSTVRRLLQEPVAKGLQIMNRRQSGTSEFKPKEVWIYHKVEPVVDAQLWEQVNLIVKKQARQNAKPLNLKVHLFTGYIYCSCGGRMYTNVNTPSYVCSKSCGNKINKEDLEEIFKGELYSYTVSQHRIDDYMKSINELTATKTEELERLKKKESQLSIRIEKILQLYTEGQIATEAFDTYHNKPYEQLQQIQETIRELEMEILGYATNTKSMSHVINEARSLYECWDVLEREQKRNIIETIVDRIIVDTEDIEINLFKLIPDSYLPYLKKGTNGRHTPNSMMRRSKRT